MTEEVRRRAFEPFYTTKPVGKGSGLGLSTVYGIISDMHGVILLDSRPGEGTTLTIVLPATDLIAAPAKLGAEPERTLPRQPFSQYTLLLVEDDDAVRGATRRLLAKLGFEVLTARGGEDALRICKNHASQIHVLLTDVVMPGMSGSQLAEEALRYRPHMTVVYMSGYPDDETSRFGVTQNRVQFLQKPFSENALFDALRSSLPPPNDESLERSDEAERENDWSA
jgi:FixJ family two-component response regulator